MCRLLRALCCVSMCGNGVHYDGGVFESFLFFFFWYGFFLITRHKCRELRL